MSRVVTGIDALPADGVRSAVTVGKFDGVHLGHRRVIERLRDEATARGIARTVVITFDRNPLEVLRPADAPLPLLSTAQKTEALLAAGVDLVVVIPFTTEFAALAPERFVSEVLVGGLSAECVLVGADFRYGANGGGTVDTLRVAGEQLDFAVALVDDVCVSGGERISSTGIRRLLEVGHVAEAAEALGRLPRIRSEVVPGYQRGRTMGYPTANLAPGAEGFIPADGVYACWMHVDGQRFGAAVSVGNNPTFGDVPEKTVEAHAVDVTVDLYGKVVELEFVRFIRGMRKFPSADALAHQMGVDEVEIRGVLGLQPAP
ncbi:FMN adenylyltransferase /riboflavin kinase [Microcella putealis]|uniref:Riboflavin biosynthesis protein n=1 Tax=Microcella putealis TaxID=337005 RepID=A0A4Q7LVI4_9MICO|nr:bifunctional riboflavin kinase/FAD synthetase [Microcella putealis]RZS59066.1 FMN adenylyltransferase /riboflavin kinase [Microcella putealis]TQM24092.1 FMN adenylyltransferase /riboflavin kinase [Microcella putealis]